MGTGGQSVVTKMANLIDHTVRSSEFALVSFNIRSIYPKIDSFDLLVQESKPDLININETWLNNAIPNQSVSLEGYDIIRLDRSANIRGGGLASYIKQDNGSNYDNLKYNNLNILDSDIELHIFSLKVRMMKKMLILNIYRPPNGNLNQFFEKIENVLNSVRNLNEFELYITGIFPLMILNHKDTRKSKAFQSNLDWKK